MKRKNASLTTASLIDFGEMVCSEISCEECPQRGSCDIWVYQPEVYKNLAVWYLSEAGCLIAKFIFKVAK